jgi:Cu-processing system permease protein
MNVLLCLAGKEIRDGMRNRWIAATIVVLAALALGLSLLGSAPVGPVKASTLSITVASLSSLSVYLIPLIALMLSYDALVGEFERGTMQLLLTYPVARWQVIVGKFLGHVAVLVLAIVIGYGIAGLAVAARGGADSEGGRAFLSLMGSSVALGAVFIGLGYFLSAIVRERATAAGLAVALWLALVVLYDLTVLGVLIADQGRIVTQTTVSILMAINPTDLYRVYNLTSFDGTATAAGMLGVEGGLGPLLSLMALGGWIAVPLGATIAVFQRREL